MNITLYRCTVCGRVGTVGRCCGDETREPLNDLARREQEKIKAQNLPKADAYSLLGAGFINGVEYEKQKFRS